MDIEATKIALIKEVLNIQNEDTLLKVKKLLDESTLHSQAVNEQSINYDTLKATKESRKLAFINDFINLENEETISKLENLLWKNNDFWNELSTSQKDEIERADIEIINGDTSNYIDFITPHLR